ncbi:hypothetical protein BC835DRAFT_1206029, partial [Cytidiella melzeri]
WSRIITNWVLIEEELDFGTPATGLPPAGRPYAINLWIQNARRNGVVIKPDGHAQFQKEWFAWWDCVNPEWRQRDSGRLVIGGVGDWSAMFKPGKCGFLLVLECL